MTLLVQTIRAVRTGEELFLDYALMIDGDDPADYPCACGADDCRGAMVAPPVAVASRA